jgi:hypothetical protein
VGGGHIAAPGLDTSAEVLEVRAFGRIGGQGKGVIKHLQGVVEVAGVPEGLGGA